MDRFHGGDARRFDGAGLPSATRPVTVSGQHRAWVEISPGAIAHNAGRLLQLLTPRAQLMAVVKADAYGHGAESVAGVLMSQGVQRFATATTAEAVRLRASGIHHPILVFAPVTDVDEAEFAVRNGLTLTIGDRDHLNILQQAARNAGSRAAIHLNVDTGMCRIGCSAKQCLQLRDRLESEPLLDLQGVYSHLATAEKPDSEAFRVQTRIFAELRNRMIGHRPSFEWNFHLANTAAAITSAETHYDQVRAGLGLYGIHPADHLRGLIPLQPAMSVRARVLQVRSVREGQGISYGHSYVARSSMKIAVVSIGYADGVPRGLSGHMDVLLRGQRCRQVGMITMDQLMVDVSGVSRVGIGDAVTLIGSDGHDSVAIGEWAAQLRTIPYELLCGFTGRLPRVTTGHSVDRTNAESRPSVSIAADGWEASH